MMRFSNEYFKLNDVKYAFDVNLRANGNLCCLELISCFWSISAVNCCIVLMHTAICA
jgi:hypothetical protein